MNDNIHSGAIRIHGPGLGQLRRVFGVLQNQLTSLLCLFQMEDIIPGMVNSIYSRETINFNY